MENLKPSRTKSKKRSAAKKADNKASASQKTPVHAKSMAAKKKPFKLSFRKKAGKKLAATKGILEDFVDSATETVTRQSPVKGAQNALQGAKNALKKLSTLEPRQLSGRTKIISLSGIVLLGAGLIFLLWPSPSGTLTVRANQPAEVLIDGESHGSAPLEDIKLDVGKHRIKVRHERTGDERTYVRRIKEDRKSRIRVSWNTEPPKSDRNRSDKRRGRNRK